MIDASPRELEERIRGAVRDVPDFPKPGILFKDITPVLGDGELFAGACEALARPARGRGITHVAGIESRGFILGAPVAQLLGVGFVPVRKPGKLPSRTEREEYVLEYGTDALEVHSDACGRDSRVLLVDDVLATGGTASATCRLIERLGATVVACAFLVELGFLAGGEKLSGREYYAAVRF